MDIYIYIIFVITLPDLIGSDCSPETHLQSFPIHFDPSKLFSYLVCLIGNILEADQYLYFFIERTTLI